MKSLIKHYFLNNQQEMLDKSYINCHVKGLHSLMLSDCPGKMIRLYITSKGHNMNTKGLLDKPLPLSIHAHHCNLTLTCVYGQFNNLSYYKRKIKNLKYIAHPETYGWIDKYKYQSAVIGGEEGSKFEHVGREFLEHESQQGCGEGTSVYLPAKQLHTVSVDGGEIAAWLVLEGQEDSNYESVCYNSEHPSVAMGDPAYMYIRPTLFEVEMLLQSIKVL